MNEEWARLDAAAGRSIGQRRFTNAVALLRQAIALRPDHADSWFNLGYVLRQMRAYPEALDAYARDLVDYLGYLAETGDSVTRALPTTIRGFLASLDERGLAATVSGAGPTVLRGPYSRSPPRIRKP